MAESLKLLTLRAPAAQFDPSKGAEGLPQRILALAWGHNTTAQGPVIVNDTTIKRLHAYNASQNWDRPVLDFEHNSVPGSPTYKGEPCAVAGYGTLEIVEGQGIYMLMSSWTKDGQDYAGGGHYGDLSPVVKVNERNEVIGLHSVALCRHGATEGLIFLSATTATHTAPMDKKPPQNAEELLANLRTLLGLGADSAPGDVLTALSAKLETKPAEGSEEAKQLSALVGKLETQLTSQGESLKLLSSSLEAAHRGEILANAVREGKDVPEMAKTLPIDQLKLLCAQLPVTVPLEKRTPDAAALKLLSSPQAVAEADDVSKHTGVSKEDREKYGR